MPNFDEETVHGISLFDRLTATQPAVSPFNIPDSATVLHSIKNNVERILNTRLGDSLSSPKLGLLDFNDAMLSSHNLSQQIQQGIYDCILRYEPRIKTLRFTTSNDETSPLMLRLKIEAILDTSSVHKKVQLELLLDNNRRYRVI